jgi:CRISPR-associated protein Csb2
MIALALRFPAGRYHATPWGRHVNEAAVAWPPDPWRLTRAFIATWHRKLDHELFPKAQLRALLATLAKELPVYRLPLGAVHSHTRHYMPVREGSKDKNALVFDAFAHLDRDVEAVVAWPNLELDDQATALLDCVLESIGYLGRAESWVEARRLCEWEGEPNCQPGERTIDLDTGELSGEIVPLMAPLTPEAYSDFRDSLQGAFAANQSLKKTLPEDWVDALSVDSAELQKAGWNRAPAGCTVNYLRPLDCLTFIATPRNVTRKASRTEYTTARYALYGKPLPRIEDAVRVGELLRAAMMAKAKALLGLDHIPKVFSGHDLPEHNRHGHAFYLPEDADGDGYVDHLIVHAGDGLDWDCRRVLDDLTRLWAGDGREWRLVLEAIDDATNLCTMSSFLVESAVWESVTPYLYPWYAKKSFTIEDQIRRECRHRDLRVPAGFRLIPSIRVGARERLPSHFRRFRSKRGLVQPDRQGSFWTISFSEAVRGPLALGFGCHFGLGLFRPGSRNLQLAET